MSHHHLVVGAGPVGSTIAAQLADGGTQVTVMTRSGGGPKHPLITLVAGDAANVDDLVRHGQGAAAIYNCINPPYNRWAEVWPSVGEAMLAAAERTGAVLVMMDNLYALGPDTAMPMTETSPMRAQAGGRARRKGATRRRLAEELLAAHAAGRVRATLVRASDFFGPGVKDAAMGERVVPKVIAGKKVSVLGRTDVPHATSYMPDVARTMIAAATNPAAWGKPWQVPNAAAVSQAQTVAAFATAAGTSAKVGTVPKVALTILGVFVPVMRELKETWYQFAEPWTTDSSTTTATLGVHATPLPEAAAATVAWWRAQPASR